MEYQLAEELSKPVFRFIATKDCAVDNPDDPPEDEERAALQHAYINRIASTDHLRYSFSSREQLLDHVRVLRLPPRHTRRLLVAVLLTLLVVACTGAYFAVQTLTYDDPCREANKLLLTIPDESLSQMLEAYVPQGTFKETDETPQTPPGPDRVDCHLKVVNETGRPIRIWRYFPKTEALTPMAAASRRSKEPVGDAGSVSRSESSDPKRYKPWRPPLWVCGSATEKLPAIGGWSYVVVEDLEESLRLARRRSPSPDGGGAYAWFMPVRKGWIYLPYGKDSALKLSKGLFETGADTSSVVVLPEQ
jgi:hypothetical protein